MQVSEQSYYADFDALFTLGHGECVPAPLTRRTCRACALPGFVQPREVRRAVFVIAGLVSHDCETDEPRAIPKMLQQEFRANQMETSQTQGFPLQPRMTRSAHAHPSYPLCVQNILF